MAEPKDRGSDTLRRYVESWASSERRVVGQCPACGETTRTDLIGDAELNHGRQEYRERWSCEACSALWWEVFASARYEYTGKPPADDGGSG